MSQEALKEVLGSFELPLLIVSTKVGKGNVSVGDTVKDMISENKMVRHCQIEDLLPPNAVNEDLLRYRFISNNFPFLLNLVYRIPFFYYRKLIREKYIAPSDLSAMKALIASYKPKTVIGVSHRATFWLSVLKWREDMDFKLWGILTEFGKTLGWKYITWDTVDGFLSPINADELGMKIPRHVKFATVPPICGTRFYGLRVIPGNKQKVLFVAGSWGQIFAERAERTIKEILNVSEDIRVVAVCGTNKKLKNRLADCAAAAEARLLVYGEVDSLFDLMRQCGSVVTKPGFSTLAEAHAAQRGIFLMKGMPVAEDNNARYALKHFGAQWFTAKSFQRWYYEK